METDSKPNVPTPPQNPRQLKLWFAIGFVAVFLGMLLLCRMTVMDPSGQYAMRSSLWQFYATYFPRQFAVRELGPMSGMSDTFWLTFAQHILLSTVGGGESAAVGRYLQTRRLNKG